MIARHEGAAEAMSHAVRPWNSLDAKSSPSEFVHTVDPKEVVDGCLSCKRPYCTGDCEKRSQLSRRSVPDRSKKGIDPEKIAELRAKGMSIPQIGKELGIARSSAKYWVRKLQIPGPVKKKKAKEYPVPKEDPCGACRNAYLCKTRNWTCSEKERWKTACGSR